MIRAKCINPELNSWTFVDEYGEPMPNLLKEFLYGTPNECISFAGEKGKNILFLTEDLNHGT